MTALESGVTEHTYTYSISDPGTDDVHQVTVSCGTGGTLSGTPTNTNTSGSFKCKFLDGPASPTVTVKRPTPTWRRQHRHDDVAVANVNPTATLGNGGPVNEGSPVSVSFSAQFDPSPTDTAAGLRYAFSCPNGDLSGAAYATASTVASTSCTFPDGPATNTVKARIIDKDGGFTEYTTDVAVANVAPTIVSLTSSPSAAIVGQTILIVGTATDPSSADTAAQFSWRFDTGSGVGCLRCARSQHDFEAHHGLRPADDQSSGKGQGRRKWLVYTITVGTFTAQFLPPLKEGVSNVVQKGRVVPVQITFGCNGFISGLSPRSSYSRAIS